MSVNMPINNCNQCKYNHSGYCIKYRQKITNDLLIKCEILNYVPTKEEDVGDLEYVEENIETERK